ncbi:adenylosuccinate lyase [Erysipelotrichaceae bacterium MTC7]|nr:adenylosuccinate lyase [Erysipelotrichaceae bacterium MTC7]
MRALYDSKSKLDDRGIKALLTEEAKVNTWLQVEAALALSQAECGFIPEQAAKDIAASCKMENIDMEEIARIKAKIGHGFVPFLKVLTKACPAEAGKYVHYGVTTQNIQQTSHLYLLKQVNEIIKGFTADCLVSLANLATKHANDVMPGRTHGKHAIPITYGYKVSVWISELLSNFQRMEDSEKRIFQVMMGGAVGSFNSMGPVGREVQDHVAKKLNMGSMEVPSRNMSIPKVEFISNLAMLCNTFHKMAEEVYYTGLEELGEVSEGFTPGTVGSSTMPQKINPKLAKGIIANSQKLYSLPAVGYYSAVRMFEGDSSSYLLFDGLLEEAVELATEVLIRAEELTRTIQVHPERMKYNANLNKGLDNSEHIMMEVAKKIGKDPAHELMYDKAMLTEIDGKDYLTVLKEDATISSMFTEAEIEALTNPETYVGEGPTIAHEMAEKAMTKAKEIKDAV